MSESRPFDGLRGAIDRTMVEASASQERVARYLAVGLHHPAVLYLASVGRSTRAGRLYSLSTAARFFGASVKDIQWHELSFAHLTALRAHLVERGLSPSTGNNVLCAVRGVLKFAARLGQMKREAAIEAGDVPPIRGYRVPVGRSLAQGEIAKMVEVCNRNGLIGIRDRALLALLFGAGLRRHEVARLNVDSLYREGELLVLGKGDKQRTVPLPEGAERALRLWIEARAANGAPAGGPLFLRISKSQRLLSTRLSRTGVYWALHILGERAKVAPWTPHDARRTYAGDLLDEGVDLVTVQNLLGHASPVTTSKYDRRGKRARIEAATRIRFPFASPANDAGTAAAGAGTASAPTSSADQSVSVFPTKNKGSADGSP